MQPSSHCHSNARSCRDVHQARQAVSLRDGCRAMQSPVWRRCRECAVRGWCHLQHNTDHCTRCAQSARHLPSMTTGLALEADSV